MILIRLFGGWLAMLRKLLLPSHSSGDLEVKVRLGFRWGSDGVREGEE